MDVRKMEYGVLFGELSSKAAMVVCFTYYLNMTDYRMISYIWHPKFMTNVTTWRKIYL